MAMLRTKGSSVWECKNPSALSEILSPTKKTLAPLVCWNQEIAACQGSPYLGGFAQCRVFDSGDV